LVYNIALVGAGRIGHIHAANVAAHPELTLTHVVDVVPANAQGLATSTGARASSIEEALCDPEVRGVIVASSTDAHLDHCLAAHRADKAIFCEKPVDLDLGRAEGARSELAEARLFVAFNRRFDPNFQVLKDRLADGAIGDIESVQITSNDPAPPPVSYLRSSGGLFKDMAIHDFDMARHLLEEEPVEVFATGSCLVDPAIGEAGDIDTARTILRTGSGKLCVIANSRRSAFGYDQRIEVFGSKGMIKADNERESTVSIWSDNGSKTDAFRNFFLERYAAAYRAEIAHFADMVSGRAEAIISFSDGVAALRLADAAALSLKLGRPVPVEVPGQ
jgi:myo-inositol 2-dehydrogenase / D-chiro-inositol 1-dehydrogenase